MVGLSAEYFSNAKASRVDLNDIPPVGKIFSMAEQAFKDVFIPSIDQSQNKMAGMLQGVDLSAFKGVLPTTQISSAATVGMNTSMNNEMGGRG